MKNTMQKYSFSANPPNIMLEKYVIEHVFSRFTTVLQTTDCKIRIEKVRLSDVFWSVEKRKVSSCLMCMSSVIGLV